MSDIQFSVRADLFRVAQGFAHVGSGAPVRLEPLPGGGVVMIGWDQSLIAIEDVSGELTRPCTIAIGRALLNMAVDLFRRDGVNVRLQGAGGLAYITPDTGGGQAARFDGGPAAFPDWRAVLARHAIVRLETPIVLDGRIAKNLSDAAIGLARAAGAADELFELKGGIGATLATFPSFPKAVAMLPHHAEISAARKNEPSTLWHPPAWVHQAKPLALVK